VYGRRFTPAWLLWSAGAAVVVLLGATGLFLLRQSPGPEPVGVSPVAVPDNPGVRGSRSTPSAAQAGKLPPASDASMPTSGSSAGVISRGPPIATMADILSADPAQTTTAAAFRRLLALWGKVLTSDKDPCAQAAVDGLACLSDRGSWGQLRALNRPAILDLNDDRGGTAHVVLTGLTDEYATLALGEKGQRVALPDISRYWMGGYTLVWKPRSGKPRELSAGMRGEQVQWLRRSLAAVRGDTSGVAPPDVYDKALVIAVQDFQREHRLTADGVAGLTTQVMLDTALAEPGSPLLQPGPRRGG